MSSLSDDFDMGAPPSIFLPDLVSSRVNGFFQMNTNE